jgi:predicted RND superfamily exporter protein
VWDRVLYVSARRPVWCGLLIAGLCLVCGHLLFDVQARELRLPIDASIEGLLPVDDPALQVFKETVAVFGDDDVLLVAWFADALFSPEILRELKELHRELVALPFVEGVDSLVSAQRIVTDARETHIESFLSHVPATLEEGERLRREALADPLYRGQIVSDDGRGTLLVVRLTADDSDALAAQVDQIAELSSSGAPRGVTAFVSGPVFARLETSRVLFRDLRVVLPLAVLGTLLIAAIGMRTVRGVVLPLLANSVALLITLAIYAATGHSLNFVTVVMPPVVFVVGFAYAVHVVSDYDRQLQCGKRGAEAVEATLRELLLPLSLTAGTTAVGFASLAASNIESIRTFGLYSAAGTLVAWLAAWTVVPIGLRVFGGARSELATEAERGALVSFAPKLARFDTRHRSAIVAAGAVVAILSALAATRIDVSTDFLANFPRESAVRRDFERLSESFSGAVPIRVLVRADRPGRLLETDALRAIEDLDGWLDEQPEVGGVASFSDVIALLYRGFAPSVPEEEVPSSEALTEQLLLLGGGDETARFVDARYQQTLLHTRSTASASGDMAALIARVEARLAELPAGLTGYVTGSSVLVARTIDDITRGQIRSLLGALLVIYLVLATLFGSFRVGALALVPNALPILAYFGLLGFSGITLNATTGLVASIVLGIAVDDSIHFLSRFNHEARRVADEEAGVERALSNVIRPVTFTTAAMCLGFSGLLASELRNQTDFGMLAAATLAFAWLLDLTFTPALASRLRFVTLWEALTVDLGAAPHKTIPLFSGLSHRQARVAALMGAIESFEPGARIFQLGDTGSEICVVIDGELVATLPREGEDRVLRPLQRGDLIGEVALFHGTRTANVDARTPVRVLRLNEGCLERLQVRYPRIATQLYRNLGGILAHRLADTTDRL